MPVFARPAEDISRGSWVTHSGGTVNLWATIDEESADDNDFVASSQANNSAYEVLLSAVPPAVIPRAHSLILRGRKDQANGNQRGVDVSLVQGTTVLGTQSFPTLGANVNQEVIDLPRAMAAGITNYADLRVRFTPTGSTSGGSSRRRVIITGVALRVPAAVDLVDDLLVRWGITVDQSNGVWQVSRSGFVGTGETLAYAIWRLYQAMIAANWNAEAVDERFAIAYGLWKVIEYERIHAEIVAGTYPLPPHQTQAEGIAICDQKIATFIASARTADAEEGS